MTTIEKIKTLLLSKEQSKETKMYAEMILDDGRVLATEDDQFMIGSVVMVVGDDGETSALAAGTYTMSDGAKLTIDEDSKILDMGEEKEAEEVENEEEKEEMQEEEEKEMEEIDEEKLSKAIFENTPDKVGKDKAKEMAKKVKQMYEEEKEEMSEEVEEVKDEEMVEMSKDMVSSLVEEVEELKSQIVELEKTPGAEGFTHNPEVYNKSEKVDLSKMTAMKRAAYYINNK